MGSEPLRDKNPYLTVQCGIGSGEVYNWQT
jgi:hypothetical protein